MSYRLECTRKMETKNALLVTDHDSGEELWIPLSQIEETHFDSATQKGTVVMSDWIAKQKGLE